MREAFYKTCTYSHLSNCSHWSGRKKFEKKSGIIFLAITLKLHAQNEEDTIQRNYYTIRPKKKILMYPINFRLGKNQGLRHYHAGNTKHAMVAKVKVDSSWHSLLLWSNGLSIFCLRGSRINKCRVGNTLARNSAAYPFVGVHSTDTYE